MNNKDNREIFEILDNQKAEQDEFEGRIGRAADRASLGVDYETIAMFAKYKLPLPRRLAKIAQDSHIRNCGNDAVMV